MIDTARDMTVLVKEHMTPPGDMMFYQSLGSVRSDTTLLGYASAIERAWYELALSGALCLDGRPILYLKEFNRPCSSQERVELQRLFWNQGIANVLVIADPISIYIYSGLTKPPGEIADEEALEGALVEKLTYADYIQRIQSLYHSLATGRYYDKNSKRFDPNQSVDSLLLGNLRALRNALISGNEGLSTKDAHALIGRVLFLCYLLDRGIVSVGQSNRGRTGTMRLSKILEKHSLDSGIDYLYKLFSELKNQFNGNMFDRDLDAERRLIRPSHFKLLTLFLCGDDVGTGQRTFGFWPYDFKMIPVETISAIYQDFLFAEDPDRQHEQGAYYTPRFLAEMVVDVAVRDKPGVFDGSFLDPACGSGIFLVILFNRLANRWIQAQTGPVDYATKAEALQRILDRQIRGVDKLETACRIACFSLYLAYLDFFDPPDIRAHIAKTGKPLPKLLDFAGEPNCPQADIPVILKGDFLVERTLSGKIFDCIIGNPPWAGRQKKQLAQLFMEKAPLVLRDGGTGCLLLPSKILQNQTDAFQAKWLGQVTLNRVLQLADYRYLLFQGAICPAFIALFTNMPPHPDRDLVEFVAPKFNRAGLRQGIIPVNPAARAWIPLGDIISATRSETAPVVWKRRLWGTPRDQKLLDLLQSMPSLQEQVDVLSELKKRRSGPAKRWISGQGIKPWPEQKADSASDRPLKENRWPLDTRFIETKAWKSDLLLLPGETISFEERLKKKNYRIDVLYSQPPKALFQPPMVLVSQGSVKVAFCDFEMLFQHSLQSISGPADDADLLMFLSAYLRSNISKYFLFHTSANWGIERDKVHLFELLRIPFPLPENEYASPDAGRIVSEVAKRMKRLHQNLKETFSRYEQELNNQSLLKRPRTEILKRWNRERKEQVDTFQEELEPLFYRYFGLTGQDVKLVEDTIRVFEPSSTPTTWQSEKTVTLDPVEETTVFPYAVQGLGAYSDTLTETLNTWAKAEGSDYRVSAEGGTDEETGLAMVTLRLSPMETPYRHRSLSCRLTGILKELREHASRSGESLLYERDILIFQGEHIYIVRPNILLNWTRTAALNDAARIFAEVALAGERPA
ncbi:MAG: N-6 DNA methylase [Pseudomonadota bacterium]